MPLVTEIRAIKCAVEAFNVQLERCAAEPGTCVGTLLGSVANARQFYLEPGIRCTR